MAVYLHGSHLSTIFHLSVNLLNVDHMHSNGLTRRSLLSCLPSATVKQKSNVRASEPVFEGRSSCARFPSKYPLRSDYVLLSSHSGRDWTQLQQHGEWHIDTDPIDRSAASSPYLLGERHFFRDSAHRVGK